MLAEGEIVHDDDLLAHRARQAARDGFAARPEARARWEAQVAVLRRWKRDPTAPLRHATQPEFVRSLRATRD